MLESFNLDPEFVRTFSKINNLLFIIMLVYTVIIVASSFFFSHTIAGPIYRFEKSFEEVQNGNLAIRVKLRKGDAFPELQEKFNLMLDSLQSKLIKVDRLLAELEMSGQAHKAKEIREEINKQFILNPPKFR